MLPPGKKGTSVTAYRPQKFWLGSAISSALQAAFELSKEPEIVTKVSICVDHVSLKQIAVVVLRPEIPLAVVIVLVSLPNFATESQVGGAVLIEGDGLDCIQII